MQRRDFLIAIAGMALTRIIQAAEPPKDVRITRAVGFDLVSRRSKVAGKNARLDVHGDRATDRMVRLYTNAGVEGIGNCRAEKDACAKLIGKDPFEFVRRDDRRVAGPLGAGTMPLWDLAAKLLKKPAWELMGGAGTEKVPVYDGSIYFADLLPQYADRWRDRFKAEIDLGLADGHRAFKIKIGRGSKWMPRDAGDDRDVDVVTLIRRHAGPNVLLGVDANNGYDLAGAKRFLQRAADVKLAFVEELFPETVEECLALKQFIKEQGGATLLADGETQHELEAFKPFIAARAIDIYQGDMNHFGIDGILTEAAWAAEQKLRIAPHNWGSLGGYYQQLHVGRAIPNFYRAEHDPLSNAVLVSDGYSRKDGFATLPDVPGFGLAIDEKAFARDVTIRFDVT
ncbi:MAG TPA: enolase C-terminal domain-like protein [Planctomycetaceae bacterium]